MLNIRVLAFVFRRSFGLSRGLAGKFKALFDGAKELRGDVIDIFQRGHDVGRAGNGFENLDPFERIRNLVDTFQSVSVAEKDLDTFVVVVLGRVEHRG